jgi:hypothetical protein
MRWPVEGHYHGAHPESGAGIGEDQMDPVVAVVLADRPSGLGRPGLAGLAGLASRASQAHQAGGSVMWFQVLTLAAVTAVQAAELTWIARA